MAGTLSEYYDILNKISRRHFYAIEGFLILEIVVFFIYFEIAKVCGPNFITAISFFGVVVPRKIPSLLFIFGCVIISIGVFIFWFRKRSLPRFREDELGILFAPNFPDELEDEIKMLVINLQQEIHTVNFNNKFIIKTLSPNHQINSDQDALKIIRKAGGVLIIWGLYNKNIQGNLGSFSRIKFSFVHNPIIPTTDWLTRITMQRHELRQAPDHAILVQHIGIVAKDLIGLSLYVSGNYSEASRVFLSILPAVSHKSNIPGVDQFQQALRGNIASALTRETWFEYQKHLYQGKLFDIPNEWCKKWLDQLEQAMKIAPGYPEALLSKAIYHFLLGQVDLAIRAVKKAGERDRALNPTSNFSLGFLYVFIGDYKKFRKEFKRGLAKAGSYDEEMIRQCSFFISQTIDKFPEKKQLVFLMGYIAFHRGNSDLGEEKLRKFIEISQDDPSMQEFINEAKKLLNIPNLTNTPGTLQ